MARKKKPIASEEPPEKKPQRPWYRKTDAELITDRASEIKDYLGLNKVEMGNEERDQLLSEVRRRDPSIPNLLDAVFAKTGDYPAEGRFLMVPVYRTRKGEKVAKALRLKTERGIRMDDYGWEVWNLVDGHRTVEAIGLSLKERFGDKVEPLYPRLARFIAYLANLGLIRDVARS